MYLFEGQCIESKYKSLDLSFYRVIYTERFANAFHHGKVL